MKNKVKAFTVLEVSVALLISSLVITFCYKSMGIFNDLFLKFKLNNSESAQILSLDRLLLKDTEQAEKVLVKEGLLHLIKDGESVRYEFYEDYIIRYTTLPDTFFLKNEGLNFASADSFSQTEKLTLLELYVLVHKERIPFYYKVKLNPSDLINSN